MSEKVCPRCGASSTGNFCTQCGASLGERFCNQCGTKSEPGARFCNECGAPVAGVAPPDPAPSSRRATSPPAASGARRASGGGSAGLSGTVNTLAWWVAGAVMVALILFVVYPMVAPDDGPASAAGGAAPFAGGGGAPVDLESMTPRQAADQLFDRVMRSIAAGDSAQAQQFLPMAVSAYGMARPLDLDGLFHLSMLQRTAGDLEGALATAREGLEESPDHLLLLSAAAQAAAEDGDEAVARQHYERLMEVWDEERAKALPEYTAHEGLFPEIRSEAQVFLGR